VTELALSRNQMAVGSAVTTSHATTPPGFIVVRVAVDGATAYARAATRRLRTLVGLPELAVKAIATLPPSFPQFFRRTHRRSQCRWASPRERSRDGRCWHRPLSPGGIGRRPDWTTRHQPDVAGVPGGRAARKILVGPTIQRNHFAYSVHQRVAVQQTNHLSRAPLCGVGGKYRAGASGGCSCSRYCLPVDHASWIGL
jgi:hypothetical protein